jgi:hypothetical protein
MAAFHKGTLPLILISVALSGLAGYGYGVHSSPANAKPRQVLAAGRSLALVLQMRPEAGQADQLCGPGQLSGQYECVVSAPLSEEEVRVSMAYLAAFGRLAGTRPAGSDVAALDSVRR